MDGLSKFLVDNILNEAVEQVTALFGGGFKPPTKGHLEVILNGLKQNPEINKLKIIVGGNTRNGITQNQSAKIWEFYNSLNLIPINDVEIIKASPFNYYKEYLKQHPDDKTYVFIGSREGNNSDQKDVAERSKFIKNYSSNVVPVELSTTGGISGTEARKLFKSDLDSFKNMLPSSLTDNDFKKIVNILNNNEKSTPKPESNKTEPLKPINEDIIDKTDFVLPRGKKMILQAEDEDYNRGLIVELTKEGGYKMNYWYGEDAKVYPVEVLVDGEEIKPDAKEVYMKFHPELEKENIDPKSQAKHKGKSAPFGSAYEPVNESENKEYFDFQIRIKNDSYDDLGTTFSNMDGRIQKSSTSVDGNPLIFNYRNVPSLVKAAFKSKNDNSEILIYNDERKGKVYPLTIENIKLIKRPTSLNENATYSNHIDYKQQIKDLTKHMLKKGMNIQPLPKVIFKHGDQENASQFLGKTAYYDPNDMTVVLYTEGRHPKDIARSFAHEMIHHIQNLEDRLGGINTTNTMEDDNLNDIEREAYTKGNMTFRNWTDNKDGEEVTSLNEGPQFGILYHYTEYLSDVLDDNMLRGPISLTRSRDSFVKDWIGNVPILVLDKDKLRTNYKIRPYQSYDDDEGSEDEMEEVIDKDVTNLSKYIIKVILPKPNEEYENALKEKGISYEIDKQLNESKDPFGLNQFAKEIVKEFQIEDIKPPSNPLEEQKEVRIFTPNCGCDKT